MNGLMTRLRRTFVSESEVSLTSLDLWVRIEDLNYCLKKEWFPLRISSMHLHVTRHPTSKIAPSLAISGPFCPFIYLALYFLLTGLLYHLPPLCLFKSLYYE